MTREEASFILANIDRRVCDDELNEALDIAIKALEQEPCPNAISRSDMIDAVGHGTTYTSEELQNIIKALPSVNPQPKTGCEGCIYEKTGNNSTYPCSHCGRCYTDKKVRIRDD